MATLFNTKISATYEGLFKTIDNAAITASLKELTDGSGNQSGLYVNTAGDFKVSNILEWGSLKDTGTGVTITRYVTSTDGIENFDNNTSLPTSAAVKLYVDSKFATSDTLQEVLSFGNTTGGNDIVVSASDDITFTDSSKILMGASSDLQIYHDGSNSYIIDAGTGGLTIQANADFALQSTGTNENFITAATNAFVKLYFNGNEKLATTNTGVDITGNLVVSGSITGAGGSFLPLAGGTMTGNTLHGDSIKSLYGTGNDLEVYHDGTHAVVNNTTGNVYLSSLGAIFLRTNTNETSLLANANGNLELYYDNSKKFETSSTGVSVTGALSTTADVTVGANATFVDNGKAIFGASSDFQIFHNATSNANIISSLLDRQLQITSNNLFIGNQAASENMITAIADGAVSLYYDNTKRIETVSAGAKVTGNLEVTGTITGSGGSFLPLAGGTMTGDTIHNDNVKSIYGTSSDGLEVYHDGSHSYLKDSGTGDLKISSNTVRIESNGAENMIIASANGAVNLYYNNNQKIATTNTGISVTGNGVFSGNVSVPDNQYFTAGTGGDLLIRHLSSDNSSYIQNYTGDFNIENRAVTQSIVFKVSDANAGDTTALTISRNADASFGRDVTIAGDLTVNGTTTTVNSQTLAVVDPLIQLAKDNTANSLDIGLYGDYNDGTDRFLGLFSDASDGNKFKLFKGTTVEPTTTVNIGATGYVAADLVVAGLESSSFISTGTVSATSFISTTDAGININGLTLTRVAANTAFRTSGGLETLGLLRSYAGLNVAQTATFGGNATFAGDVSLADNKKLKFGTGSDLEIYHSGSDSYIKDSGTGDVRIVASATKIFDADQSHLQAAFIDGGSVDLYYSGNKKFETTSTGVTITGGWVTDGVSVATSNVEFTDNSKAMFGNGNDLQIYHDGSNSYISDVGTGSLLLKTSALLVRNPSDNSMLDGFSGGAINLYYNGSKKLETTDSGIKVTSEGYQINIEDSSSGNISEILTSQIEPMLFQVHQWFLVLII